MTNNIQVLRVINELYDTIENIKHASLYKNSITVIQALEKVIANLKSL